MRIPKQSIGISNTVSQNFIRSVGPGISINSFFDLCNWFELPWCESPAETCYYDRTDTSCWGVVQMCKNKGRTTSGKECSGGWYACGVCLGLPW